MDLNLRFLGKHHIGKAQIVVKDSKRIKVAKGFEEVLCHLESFGISQVMLQHFI